MVLEPVACKPAAVPAHVCTCGASQDQGHPCWCVCVCARGARAGGMAVGDASSGGRGGWLSGREDGWPALPTRGQKTSAGGPAGRRSNRGRRCAPGGSGALSGPAGQDRRDWQRPWGRFGGQSPKERPGVRSPGRVVEAPRKSWGEGPEGSGSGFRPGLEHLTDAHRQPPDSLPGTSGELSKPRERGPGAIAKVEEERPGRAARMGPGRRSLLAGQAWAARALDEDHPPTPPPPGGKGKWPPQVPVHLGE